MSPKVYHFFLQKTERNEKGKITGHIKMGDVRLLFTRSDGTLLDDEGVKKVLKELRERLPPDWTIDVIEKEVGITASPRFEAACPEHGKRENEFFCGKCGKPLKPTLVP